MQLCKQMVLVLQNGRTDVLILLEAQILERENSKKTKEKKQNRRSKILSVKRERLSARLWRVELPSVA
jgi:protein subunit release factor A